MNKVKGFLKMKRGLLTLIVAVSVSVFAVAQLTKANDGCPDGQVQTPQGCTQKSGETSIPTSGDRIEPEPQPAPSTQPSEPTGTQPTQPTSGCSQ